MKLSRKQRRVIAAVIGLTLGWFAAGYARSQGWLPW